MKKLIFDAVSHSMATHSRLWRNVFAWFYWGQAWLEKSKSAVRESLVIMEPKLCARPKLLNTIVLWCARGFRRSLICAPMMKRDASLSDRCTSDRCSFWCRLEDEFLGITSCLISGISGISKSYSNNLKAWMRSHLCIRVS